MTEKTNEQQPDDTVNTEARDHLLRALEADLIGPYDDSGEEVLEKSPYRWYLTGFLAPVEYEIEDVLDDEDEQGAGTPESGEDSDVEEESSRKNFFPNSMGLTFLVPGTTGGEAVVDVSWGDYEPWHGDSADHLTASLLRDDEGASRKGRTGRNAHVFWKRVARSVEGVRLSLTPGEAPKPVPVPGSNGLTLQIHSVTTGSSEASTDEMRAVSVFLVNERDSESVPLQLRASAFIFQARMRVRSTLNPLPRGNPRDHYSESWDSRVSDLQYRDLKNYGKGHNVSARDYTDAEGQLVLETTWLPTGEATFVKANSVAGVTTSMTALGKLSSPDEVDAALREIPAAYREWITSKSRLEFDTRKRSEVRDDLMLQAEGVSQRIEAGIELLKSNDTVRRAFCLTNQAMMESWYKRKVIETRQSEDGGRIHPKKVRENAPAPHWRLFQLAFLLMNIVPTLKDRARDTKSSRATVDLLYFPTGGGKTEAYFGVAAFTMVLRRLLGDSRTDRGEGVAIFLRYTLRLLTLDQLDRASTLICALETVRARTEGLGDAPFRVGLWVGRSTSPNTLKDADRAITTAKGGGYMDSSFFPLSGCPNCGEPVQPSNAKVIKHKGEIRRINVYCDNHRCEYSAKAQAGSTYGTGIPVEFIDEQIYRTLPAFVIGTVDKFALVPYRAQSGALFGNVVARKADGTFVPASEAVEISGQIDDQSLPHGLEPPELIIQDEVHLISGPLGSMVGIYEFMIEELCRHDRSGGGESEGNDRLPRIIASTATVRRASKQLRSLFGRDRVTVFPPQGTESDDSFFAIRDDDRPARQYVGVAATGRSLKKVLKKSYITLLAAAEYNRTHDVPGHDPYMSLVGYFNSLRELGGMRLIVDDEVYSALQHVEGRKPSDQAESDHLYFSERRLKDTLELTSRVGTAQVNRVRERLSNAQSDKGAVDVALASNMISVGVDIGRLGLMVVAGQPKTTSEYIQATSRVGRQYPGLIVTCFNIHRARDRSHYEDFSQFHQAFYRDVESTSLTPFAVPVVERALAGVLFGFLRHTSVHHSHSKGVMDALNQVTTFKRFAERLRVRIERVESTEKADAVVKRLNDLRDGVLKRIEQMKRGDGEAGSYVYGPYEGSASREHNALLRLPQDANANVGSAEARSGDLNRRLVAPTSMRDVEPSSAVWIDLPKVHQ